MRSIVPPKPVDRVAAVTEKRVTAATEAMLGLAADRAKLDAVRRELGQQLARYRQGAGFSQRQLAEAAGISRCTVSLVESSKRGFSEAAWAVVDAALSADGALLTHHGVVADAEREHHAKVRRRRSELLHAAAQVQEGSAGLDSAGSDLAEEIVKMITRLARQMGRRDAVRVVFGALAVAGLSGVVDVDDFERMALAVGSPQRVDARVVESFAIALTQFKRQQRTLGPSAVVGAVVAQYDVVQGLLAGGCPEGLTRPLLTVQSDMAREIGSYQIDLGNQDAAQRYLQEARRAGHDAQNRACSARAAAVMSHLAFLRGEMHTAKDMAAVARSLAAGTSDSQLKAESEQYTASAFALDGQHGRCMAAHERAIQLLSGGTGSTPNSLAHFVDETWLTTKQTVCLVKLDRPRAAVDAASNALARLDRQPGRRNVQLHAFAKVRLGAALVLSEEVDEAARVLGDVASVAGVNPRLAVELRDARAGMRQWERTRAVKTLDEQLAACRGESVHPPSL